MAGIHGGAWGDDSAADGDEPHGLADDRLDADSPPAPESSSPRMHDDIPIRGYNRGEPVPDLALLPRERRREVLCGLSPYTRQLSKNTVSTMDDAIAAGILTVRGVDRMLYDERRAR